VCGNSKRGMRQKSKVFSSLLVVGREGQGTRGGGWVVVVVGLSGAAPKEFRGAASRWRTSK